MPSNQEQVIPRCPRCGGRMYKPAGSTLYWHADNNHPPCEITNIVDVFTSAQAAKELPDAPGAPPPTRPKK
jgi:hypothetical protein